MAFWTDDSLKKEVERLSKVIIDANKKHEEKVVELNNTIKRIGEESFNLRKTNDGYKKKLEEKNDVLRKFKETFKELIK
jgi:hypothetical protein